MFGRDVFEYVSQGSNGLIHAIRVVGGAVISIWFKKKDEPLTLIHKREGQADRKYTFTIEELAAKTFKQYSTPCRGLPYRVVHPSDPAYQALGLNQSTINSPSRLDLMSCDALTNSDIQHLMRTFSSIDNDMANIAYRTAIQIMAHDAGTVDVLLPSQAKFMDEKSLTDFFVAFITWNISGENRFKMQYQNSMKLIHEYTESERLRKEAEQAAKLAETSKFQNELVHTALNSASLTALVTSISELAIILGLREREADKLIKSASVLYLLGTAGIEETLKIVLLNYVVEWLTDKFFISRKLKALSHAACTLTLQTMLNESYTIQESAITLLVSHAASVFSYFTTSTLIQTGYKMLTRTPEVVNLKTPVENQAADLIVDDIRVAPSKTIEREFTVPEIAKILFEFVLNQNLNEAEALLNEVKKSNADALKIIINYVHHDLSSMPTALGAACQLKDASMAKLLLSHDPNLDYGSEQGTPLLLAVRAGNLALVKMLCKLKADITCLDPDTNGNLLHIAAENHAVDILVYLRHAFKPGTFDLAACNRSLKTPLEAAGDDAETAAVLLAMMQDIKQAAKDSDREKIRRQIEAAGFSDAGKPCNWHKNADNFALVIPCQNNQQLANYLSYLTITEHAATPDCVSISEESAFCLAVQAARDEKLWLDYCRILKALQHLMATAGFACDITFTHQTAHIQSDSPHLLKLVAALKLKSILTLNNESLCLQLGALSKLTHDKRTAAIETIEHRQQYYQTLRHQFAALRHGIPARKIKLIHGHIVVALTREQVPFLLPMLGYFHFARSTAMPQRFSVCCERYAQKACTDLPVNLVQYKRQCETRLALFLAEAKKYGECITSYEDDALHLEFYQTPAHTQFVSACATAKLPVIPLATRKLACSYKIIFACTENTFATTVKRSATSPVFFATQSSPTVSHAAVAYRDEEEKPKPPTLRLREKKSGSKAVQPASSTKAAALTPTSKKVRSSKWHHPAVPEQQPRDLELKTLKSADKYVYVPCQSEQAVVYKLAKARAEAGSSRQREKGIPQTVYERVIRYEISFLIGLQLWFNDLSLQERGHLHNIHLKLGAVRFSVIRLLWAMFMRVKQAPRCQHITYDDFMAWDIRNKIVHEIIPAENIDLFVYYLLDKNFQETFEAVLCGEPKQGMIILSKFAHFFKQTDYIDACRQTTIVMTRLTDRINHFAYVKNDHNAPDDDLDFELPEESDADRKQRMREARSLYSDIIELVNLFLRHGKHLFNVSEEVRYFMESCISMRNQSLHHAINDETSAYDPIPISLVFAKALEGAAIWNKAHPACSPTTVRVSSPPPF